MQRMCSEDRLKALDSWNRQSKSLWRPSEPINVLPTKPPFQSFFMENKNKNLIGWKRYHQLNSKFALFYRYTTDKIFSQDILTKRS